MKKELELIEERQVERMKTLGEMCVKHARMVVKDVGFKDESGNLESSIGYKVFKDGVSLHSKFDIVNGGSKGAAMGAELAEKIGGSNTRSVMLVITFGLDYAYHVEPKVNDVSVSLEEIRDEDLPTMMFLLLANIEFSSKMMTDK